MPKAKATKAKSLHVESMSKARDIDTILSNGCTTIVVILADWCGACKRVKPMWLNALKKKKTNNLVLINNEVLPQTSLNTLNITHFPSTFKIPSGGTPTLLDNPQDRNAIENTLNSMNEVNSMNEMNSMNEVDENEVDENEVPGLETPITASEYVSMRTMGNTSMNEAMNKLTSMNIKNIPYTPISLRKSRKTARLNSFTPRNGFTPSLEKLKGGRRTRKRRT